MPPNQDGALLILAASSRDLAQDITRLCFNLILCRFPRPSLRPNSSIRTSSRFGETLAFSLQRA